MHDLYSSRRRACALLLLSVLLSLGRPQTIAAQDSAWTTTGPEGGWITSLVIDPQNPATIYAGTFSAGVFKSTDGGTTWIPINGGLREPLITELAIDPRTPATLYIGTNEGVSKTGDAGGVWRDINNGLPASSRSVSAIGVDPGSPTIVYVKLAFHSNVFKSLDGGESWTSTAGVIDDSNVTALVIDPHATSTLYMGGLSSGVRKSEDGGTSWRAVNNGLTNNSVEALVLDPATPTTLYAGTRGGIFKSTDGGNSWNGVNNGLSNLLVRALAIDPVVPTTLYVGAGAVVFKSMDAGASWSTSGAGLPSGTVTALAVDPRASATLYAGSDPRGVFRSSDGGDLWGAANSGLIATSIGALTVDPHSTGVVYAGRFKTVDGGQSWNSNDASLPSGSVRRLAIDPLTPMTMYATTPDGVAKTTDGGSSWSAINNGLTDTTFLVELVIDPQTPSIVYVASGSLPPRIFKTVDGGAQWVRVGSPGPTEIATLAIDPLTPTTLYAGTFSGLYKTTNGGESWPVTGLSGGRVFEVAIDPQNPAVLYAYESCCNGPRVMKSVDGGASWIAASNGLPTADRITALAVDPETPSTLYAGVRRFSADAPGGVFRSTDAGGSWSDISAGLANRSVQALAIAPDPPGTIYAGTGGGVSVLTTLPPPPPPPPPHFTLTVRPQGLGKGTVTSAPGGIGCGADCSESYVQDTAVTLTATPAFGSIFMGWAGCDDASGSRCTVTMSANRVVTATFVGLRLSFLF